MPKQIKEYPESLSANNNDKFLLQSDSDNAYKYITKNNLFTGLSNTSGSIQYIQFADVKPNGVDGGNGILNDWTDREINTKLNDDTNEASLINNAFKLPNGGYIINISSPFYLSAFIRIRLLNFTTDSEIIRGGSEWFNNNANSGTNQRAMLSGKLNVTNKEHLFKVQYFIRYSFQSQWLLGNSAGDGGNEVYTIIDLIKVN